MLVLALRSVLHKGAHRLGLPEHRIAIVILTVLVYRLAAGRAAVVDAFNKHAAVGWHTDYSYKKSRSYNLSIVIQFAQFCL